MLNTAKELSTFSATDCSSASSPSSKALTKNLQTKSVQMKEKDQGNHSLPRKSETLKDESPNPSIQADEVNIAFFHIVFVLNFFLNLS